MYLQYIILGIINHVSTLIELILVHISQSSGQFKVFPLAPGLGVGSGAPEPLVTFLGGEDFLDDGLRDDNDEDEDEEDG